MGCVFYNADGTASRLIDEAGLKGEGIGDAVVSVLHAGFIVNRGNASSTDIISLMDKIQRTVQQKYSSQLLTEVRLIGFNEEINKI
jgi:UDP-N-acetylmuramate dehydrogenase